MGARTLEKKINNREERVFIKASDILIFFFSSTRQPKKLKTNGTWTIFAHKVYRYNFISFKRNIHLVI